MIIRNTESEIMETSKNYTFVSDEALAELYENNGLFAKIIDTPAEEAIKRGFQTGIREPVVNDYCMKALSALDWEETAMTAIKWARLFGGSIAVMLIDDGRGLEEPLNWNDIRSIDDIRVFDRSVIVPDESSMFAYNPNDPFGTRGSRLGMPEWYTVGTFRVHDSRCLVFQNGILPERTSNALYQLWGVPEYIRLQSAVRTVCVSHGFAPRLLERAILGVYKAKGLSSELATEDGEQRILRRLEAIDLARGLLNTVTIDAEGEDFGYQQINFSGLSELLSATREFLCAVSNFPPQILFSDPHTGWDSTDDTAMENWYNYIERIQRRMLLSNLRYLLSVVIRAGANQKAIPAAVFPKIEFEPLWTLSEVKKVDAARLRAEARRMRAEAAKTYFEIGALHRSEIRRELDRQESFNVETTLDAPTEP